MFIAEKLLHIIGSGLKQLHAFCLVGLTLCVNNLYFVLYTLYFVSVYTNSSRISVFLFLYSATRFKKLISFAPTLDLFHSHSYVYFHIVVMNSSYYSSYVPYDTYKRFHIIFFLNFVIYKYFCAS